MHAMFTAAFALMLLVAVPAMACVDDPTCPMHLKKTADGSIKPVVGYAADNHAEHTDHADHAMGHTSPSGANKNAATKALDDAMAAMHKAMMVPYTGDPDIDFLRGMIPHHQGAVEMAKIQLKYGRDPQVKRLAREIIRAQELEIRWMNSWAKQLEAKQRRAE